MFRIAPFVCFALVPSVFAALGDACHWSGNGGNGYWTNALNWAEGRVPGRYLVPDANQTIGYATNGVVGEVAVFGDDLVAGGATTIDFDGVYSISNLITTGTANRYTYGTSANQYVPLEPWGRLTVAELPDTPVAQLPAKLRAGVEVLCGTWDGTKWTNTFGSETVKVRNNSATEEFVFVNTWGHCTRSPLHPSGGGQTGFQVEGTGSIRFSKSSSGNTPFFKDCLTTGKLVIDTKFAMRAFDINAPGEGLPADSTTVRQIEITENGVISSSEGNQNLLTATRPLRIYGRGRFAFTAGWVSSSYWASGGVAPNEDITIECDTIFRVSSDKTAANWEALAKYPYRIVVSGYAGKELKLLGNTTIGRKVMLSDWTEVDDPASAWAICQYNGNQRIYRAETFSDPTKGFGPGVFELSAGSIISYTSAEAETMTRGLTLTNRSSTVVAGRLEQAGAGVWTVASDVITATGNSASTLYLSAVNAAGVANAVFSGTVDDKVAVAQESGDWTFAPRDGRCAKLAPIGGVMRLGGDVLEVGELAPNGANATIIVPAGFTLNVGKLVTSAAKTVNLVLVGEDATVIVDPSADNVADGLKLNGHAATLDPDGRPRPVMGVANIWKNPSDGSWNDAANWLDNVVAEPLKETFIDAGGKDYQVTLDGAESTITNLYVGSQLGDAVKLVLTNNAHLTVMGCTHRQALLQMKPGARVEVASSTLELFNRGNDKGASGSVSMLQLNGGSISVTGTGEFLDRGIPRSLRTDGGTDNQNGFLYFGTGTVEFRDQSQFHSVAEESHTVQYTYVRPDRAGETAQLNFRDQAKLVLEGNPYQCFLLGNGGRAIIDCDTEGVENPSAFKQLFIGLGVGMGEWRMRGSSSYILGSALMHVGTPSSSDNYTTVAACACTGRLEIAEKALCKVYAYETGVKGFAGVAIGQGLAIDKAQGTSFIHGELKVADEAKYEQARGSFIVGGGPDGDGEVTLTGGTIWIAADAGQAVLAPIGSMLVGGFGGNGRYVQTDGEFFTRRTVYIGGTTTNAMFRYHQNGPRIQQYHNAQGSVRVLGGKFSTTQGIVLGYDGTGTLELSGTGTVTAAAIVVSNTTGQAASTLKFTADAFGRCGAIDSAAALKFYPGAKLVVDVSANPLKRVKVLDLETPPEGLTADMIDLVGDDEVKFPHRLEISADCRQITYTVDKGLRVILR